MKLDLGALGGTSANSALLWPVKNIRGMIVGVSETANPDPNAEPLSCGAFIPRTAVTCVGFVWKDKRMTALPTLGGNNGFATAANNFGQIVGWAETTVHDPSCSSPQQVLQFKAVMWGPRPGEMHVLEPLPGDSTSAATAINDRGQVVGISGACGIAVGGVSAAHAVIWENGKPVKLDDLGGSEFHTPMAINNEGVVVGFSLPAAAEGTANFHAVIWDRQGHITDLNTLPGDAISEATGINDRGQIVGTSFTAGFASSRAFVYEHGKMTDLNTLGPVNSPIYMISTGDINNFGEVSGGGCQLVNGACDFSQEAAAFLAIPRHDGWNIDNNPPAHVVLPEKIRQTIMRRHGVRQ